MIAEHFDAVKALIRSVRPNIPVHDTDAGIPEKFPYVVLWGGDFGRSSVDVAGSQSEVAGDIGVTCVSTLAGSARQLQSTLADLLDGAQISVPGRHAFELVEQDVRPVLVDREVKLPAGSAFRFVFYGVLTYRVESTIT